MRKRMHVHGVEVERSKLVTQIPKARVKQRPGRRRLAVARCAGKQDGVTPPLERRCVQKQELAAPQLQLDRQILLEREHELAEIRAGARLRGVARSARTTIAASGLDPIVENRARVTGGRDHRPEIGMEGGRGVRRRSIRRELEGPALRATATWRQGSGSSGSRPGAERRPRGTARGLRRRYVYLPVGTGRIAPVDGRPAWPIRPWRGSG